MYSRRSFLLTVLFLLTQIGLLHSIHLKRRGKFIKQGWVLQEGDV